MKKRCYLLACLAMLLCTLLAPVTSVGAAVTWPTTSGYPAPPSFGDVDGLFSPTMGDSSLLTDPTNGHAVGLEINKDQANRSGAIWSKAPMFDLDKDSSYTMYFYMGNKPKSGEGMAFVLAAKPAAPTKVDTGSLGVWGVDHLPPNSKPQEVADTALPNSFAMVVDTQKNGTGDPGGYEQLSDFKSYYFGTGYPGQANMYRIDYPYWMTWLYFKIDNPAEQYRFGLGTQKNLYDTPANGKWNKLQLDWKKDNLGGGTLTAKMTITRTKDPDYATEVIKWTKNDIQKYFSQGSTDPAPRKLYLGFTGTTSNVFEPHVVAIGAMPEAATVNGTVALMRGAETVEATTHLKVDDVLHYDYTVNVKATSQAPWPESGTVMMNVPKGKYFDYLKADGTPAKPGDTLPIKVTIGNTDYQAQGKIQPDGNQIVVTNMPQVPKGTTATVKFSLPAKVKHHGLVQTTPVQDKPIGTVTGDGQTYDLKTPAGKDFLAYILDPETGELVLEKVPSFVFELKNGQTGYRNPTVMEMVKGLPTPMATNWDQANADQWLTNQQGREPTNSTGKVLSVKDTRPTKQGWHLTMQLSPFTLTDNSYVLGDNGNKLGGKATLVLTDQTAQIAAIKDNNNATPVKNMAAGGTDWSLGTQTGNVAAYLGIEPTATAKAGQYQATATWLLTNAPK
ncbi:WxL domain-containing protein [Lacticaseibacillus paracasei]|uniref:WxL domain-containing protein n=1 Tax=Lacticaseibacillus paracasei TaxID=1597 RepID=A0A8B3GQ20_LACPA|nr:WxL domain-containing protein [Lacticaseibacillus paracasei]RNE28775.1 hypothetical protein FAM6012_02221 [Lacticaseibacillus paracasei]